MNRDGAVATTEPNNVNFMFRWYRKKLRASLDKLLELRLQVDSPDDRALISSILETGLLYHDWLNEQLKRDTSSISQIYIQAIEEFFSSVGEIV